MLIRSKPGLKSPGFFLTGKETKAYNGIDRILNEN